MHLNNSQEPYRRLKISLPKRCLVLIGLLTFLELDVLNKCLHDKKKSSNVFTQALDETQESELIVSNQHRSTSKHHKTNKHQPIGKNLLFKGIGYNLIRLAGEKGLKDQISYKRAKSIIGTDSNSRGNVSRSINVSSKSKRQISPINGSKLMNFAEYIEEENRKVDKVKRRQRDKQLYKSSVFEGSFLNASKSNIQFKEDTSEHSDSVDELTMLKATFAKKHLTNKDLPNDDTCADALSFDLFDNTQITNKRLRREKRERPEFETVMSEFTEFMQISKKTSVDPSKELNRSATPSKISKTPKKRVEQDQFLFRPMLTKKSLVIASRLEEPSKRLISKKVKSKRKIEDIVKDKMERMCTFTPKINRKSRYIDEKSNIFANHEKPARHDKLYSLMMKSKMSEMIKREEKEVIEDMLEVQECTFKPAKIANYEGNTFQYYLSLIIVNRCLLRRELYFGIKKRLRKLRIRR